MSKTWSVTFLDIRDPRWIKFIRTFEGANIFHTPAWIILVANTYKFEPKIFALLNQDGELFAGLPLLEIKTPLRGKKWISLPFSDHCEILSKEPGTTNALMSRLYDQINMNHLDKVVVRWELSASSWHQIDNQYVIHIIKLNEDPEKVLKRLHSMHRRNIRKAQANNLRIQHGNSMDDVKLFYRLHLNTRRRQGVPIQPWAFFRGLSEQLIEKGLGFVLLVYQGDECVAGGIYLHWGATLTYKYGASLPKAQESRANNLMMWNAIEWGCINGYKSFDMGRTDRSNTGLRSYKKRWGAEEYPLTYSSSAEESSDSSMDGLMQIAEKIIQRSPLWVCRLSGEIFYKYFA